MGDGTKIEWSQATWNPVVGCTKVSPGCDHCYAERITERFHGKGSFAVVRRSEEKLYLPLKWRKPRRVFVNSMSDLFHVDVPVGFIARVFTVMAQTPQHTYQVLTKRHGRMRSVLNSDVFVNMVRGMLGEVVWPLPNVWLGVSVEDQHWADIRIPALLETPAAVRWLSCEPLLGPLKLTGGGTQQTYWLTGRPYWGEPEPIGGGTILGRAPLIGPRLDWIVVGGESGPGARPMHPDWARFLRDQCTGAGVPFFFKQWGEWCHTTQLPEATYVALDAAINLAQPHPEPHRVGKKRAGRLLDERTWDEYPAAEVPDA